MSDLGEDGTVEEIYDALDEGDPERALTLVEQVFARSSEDDPVLRLLAGVALIDLDRPAEAAEQLQIAVDLDPEDAEARANLSLALFRACRFEEAARQAEKSVEVDRHLPDAHAILALVRERQGRMEDADRHVAQAARLDPERFPPPVRLERAAFEAEIVRAGDRLPPKFRELLNQVAVTVEDVPTEAILREQCPPLDPELLGLFVGRNLLEQRHFDGPGFLPPRILLFRRNLERFARDREELVREITITLYHELGHYLGMNEDDLEELDLA